MLYNIIESGVIIMDIDFSSVEELYEKLLPVLKTKINEMKLNGINYISYKDIWDYNYNKWSKSHNLEFSDMVDDILNTKSTEYEKFLKNKWREKNTK